MTVGFVARQVRRFVFIGFCLFLSGVSVHAAGALAVGTCGAYGYAFDYVRLDQAENAARAKCQGKCKLVAIRRACAAFAVDMKNPCGAFGYAIEAKISRAQNAAMKSCYDYGGKECVIRAWACDAKG